MITLELMFVDTYQFTDKKSKENISCARFIDTNTLTIFYVKDLNKSLEVGKRYVCILEINGKELKVKEVKV